LVEYTEQELNFEFLGCEGEEEDRNADFEGNPDIDRNSILLLKFIKGQNDNLKSVVTNFSDLEGTQEKCLKNSDKNIVTLVNGILEIWDSSENLLQNHLAMTLEQDRLTIMEEYLASSQKKLKFLQQTKPDSTLRKFEVKSSKLETLVELQKILKQKLEAKISELKTGFAGKSKNFKGRLLSEISKNESQESFKAKLFENLVSSEKLLKVFS
jgi:hypothetical protein